MLHQQTYQHGKKQSSTTSFFQFPYSQQLRLAVQQDASEQQTLIHEEDQVAASITQLSRNRGLGNNGGAGEKCNRQMRQQQLRVAQSLENATSHSLSHADKCTSSR